MLILFRVRHRPKMAFSIPESHGLAVPESMYTANLSIGTLAPLLAAPGSLHVAVVASPRTQMYYFQLELFLRSL